METELLNAMSEKNSHLNHGNNLHHLDILINDSVENEIISLIPSQPASDQQASVQSNTPEQSISEYIESVTVRKDGATALDALLEKAYAIDEPKTITVC